MPRTREFDRDEALERAMELFWEQGYEATSAQDLVDHLGIGRSSLYGTFGSKHDLYLEALDRYRERGDAHIRDVLEKEEGATATLRRLFADTLEAALEDRRGCFMANAIAERAACDEAVDERACCNRDRLEELFADLVRRGQEEGDIPAGRNPVALGRFLAIVQSGVRVTARTGPSEAELRDAVEVALATLE